MPRSQDHVLTLAYLAGIIDGEGHVGIKRSKAYRCQGRATPGFHARIAVKMVDREAIELLHRTFGGSFRQERGQFGVRRPLWSWQVTDASAERAVRALSPYLRVKRRQAATLLRLRRLQRHGAEHRTKIVGYRNFPNKYGTPRQVASMSFSDEYVALCNGYHTACRNLNGLAGKLMASA